MLLRPYALASRPQELPVAGACMAALLLVFLGDVATPVQVALAALGLIPLLAAMWLLSDRLALAVGAVAFGQLILTTALGAVSLPTGISELTAYLVLGLVARLYAGSLAELLDRDRRLARSEGGQAGDRPALVLLRRDAASHGPASLTRREREVAALAAKGYTAKEIGLQLHIGERTVETHVANVCSKLGLKAKAELIRSWNG